MFVLLDRKRLEPPLPNMPAAAITHPITVNVRRQQPLHERAEIVIAYRPKDQVKMIRHQAVADQPHRHAAASLPEQTDEIVIVVGVVKHLAALVAAIEDVVTEAANSGPSGAWHGAIVARRQPGGKPGCPPN